MSYKPRSEIAALLRQGMTYVRSVPYEVTARWVFYRMLQDGFFRDKSEYRRWLRMEAKARKNFWEDWRPWSIADDTRQPVLRGDGFADGPSWLRAVGRMRADLDHWEDQEDYVELWFEAMAMRGQFEFHAHRSITLLPFGGDVSVRPMWNAAERLVRRFREDQERRIVVLYAGDLDPKGMVIPFSARDTILSFVPKIMARELFVGDDRYSWRTETEREELEWWVDAFLDKFTFRRIGLNDENVANELALDYGIQYGIKPEHVDAHVGYNHISSYSIPENPEHPGTYQWEGLDDDAARELIGEAADYLNDAAFERVYGREQRITDQFRAHLAALQVEQ